MAVERHFVVGKPDKKTGRVPNNFGTTVIGEITGPMGNCCVVNVVYAADRLQHQRLYGYKLGVINPKEYLREATPEEASFAEHVIANHGMWMPADSETMFNIGHESYDDENPDGIEIDEIDGTGIMHVRIPVAEDMSQESIDELVKGITHGLAQRGISVEKVVQLEHPSGIDDNSAAKKINPHDQQQIDQLKAFKDAVLEQRKKGKDKSEAKEAIQRAFITIDRLLNGMLRLPEDNFSEDDKTDLINLASYMNIRHARHAAEELGEAPFFKS